MVGGINHSCYRLYVRTQVKMVVVAITNANAVLCDGQGRSLVVVAIGHHGIILTVREIITLDGGGGRIIDKFILQHHSQDRRIGKDDSKIMRWFPNTTVNDK